MAPSERALQAPTPVSEVSAKTVIRQPLPERLLVAELLEQLGVIVQNGRHDTDKRLVVSRNISVLRQKVENMVEAARTL